MDGSLVKTWRFSSPRYIGDPMNAVRVFNDKEVDELIFLSIDHRIPENLKEIAEECFIPLTYGGGISHIKQAEKILKYAEKVSVNTRANQYLVGALAREFGSQSVVISVDISEPHFDSYLLNKALKDMESWGAGEFLITFVDRDGTMTGYADYSEIKCNSPVIACGGAKSKEDIYDVLEDVDAAAVGSLFLFKDDNVLINYEV